MFASAITWLRLKRYPRTTQGRRNYIKDSFVTPWYIELLICIPLAPIILILWLYVFIRTILRGLGIVICSYYEGFKELWEGRR
jgi:hypothetical protein